MSLPVPSTSASPNLSPQQLQQLDAPLIALTQRCNGDLRLVLHSFFSFLNRRTDFYCLHNQKDVEEGVKVSMGFKEGDAEKLLLAAFKQFPLRRMPPMSQLNKGTTGKAASSSASSTKKVDNAKKAPVESEPKQSEPEVDKKKVVTEEKVHDAKGSDGKGTDKEESKDEKLDGVRYTERGCQIPVGNGGSTKDYQWTQTIREVTIAMPLPSNPNTRAKDLNVEIKRSSIRLTHKTLGKTLLEGELLDKIRVDECTWSIESNVILITLEKSDKRWWNRILKEDESQVIDLELVDKTHNISDYDDATQTMVRKILFDQRQERLGLPSSDDILEEEEESKEKTGLELLQSINGEKVNRDNLPDGVSFIDHSNFPK